jgi:uncharacterized protein with FMN-binding domain
MKKFLISAVFVGAFGAYATYNYFSTNTTQASAAGNAPPATDSVSVTNTPAQSTVAPTSVPLSTPSPAKIPTPIATPVAVPVIPPKPKSTGQYVDGTYTGKVVDAYYGNIQVAAVILGGKLSSVKFLQYPNDRSTSRYINQQAMPVLKSEAIRAQSANVDGVSGASDSSAAFNQSLASALAKASA